MTKPNVLVLTGYGINCDNETRYAFESAGAQAERVHVNDLIDGVKNLSDYQILAFPGGFSYGDDIAAGRVMANKFVTNLREDLKDFLAAEKLVIGICNGFQVIVKLGLISDLDDLPSEQRVTLTYNDSDRYEDRWVHLESATDRCVFTQGIEKMYLPVAHGEGKFFAPDETLDVMEAAGQIVFRYAAPDGGPARGKFPANPNGSPRDIAAVCDRSGRVFGMMPHPERFLSFTNHPQWTAIADRLKREGKEIPTEGDGLRIFANAVKYFR